MAFHLVVLFGTQTFRPRKPFPEFDGFDPRDGKHQVGKITFDAVEERFAQTDRATENKSLSGAAHESPTAEAFLMAESIKFWALWSRAGTDSFSIQQDSNRFDYSPAVYLGYGESI